MDKTRLFIGKDKGRNKVFKTSSFYISRLTGQEWVTVETLHYEKYPTERITLSQFKYLEQNFQEITGIKKMIYEFYYKMKLKLIHKLIE